MISSALAIASLSRKGPSRTMLLPLGEGDSAAAARVAAAAELPGRRVAGHGVDAAEEQVPLAQRARRKPRASSSVETVLGRRPAPPARRRTRSGRVAPTAAARPCRRRPARTIVCSTAERIRFEPPLPSPSSSSPSREHARSATSSTAPPPGPAGSVEPERVQVLLTEHVVDVDAGAGHDHARAAAVRAGDRRRIGPRRRRR